MFLLAGHSVLSSSTDLLQGLVNDFLTVFSGVESATFFFFCKGSHWQFFFMLLMFNKVHLKQDMQQISWIKMILLIILDGYHDNGRHWKKPDRDCLQTSLARKVITIIWSSHCSGSIVYKFLSFFAFHLQAFRHTKLHSFGSSDFEVHFDFSHWRLQFNYNIMMDLPLLATYPVRFQVILIYCLDCNKQSIYFT